MKEHHLNVQIITKGILLEQYVEELVEVGLDTLRVSLDGPRELHDHIRGKNVFDKALMGIEKVNWCKQKFNVMRPRVIVNYTICDQNHAVLEEFAEEILKVQGVDSVQFKHLYLVTDNMSDRHNQYYSHLGPSTPTNIQGIQLTEIKPDVIWKQYQYLMTNSRVQFWPNLKRWQEVRDYYQRPPKRIPRSRCTTPWNSAHIQPDGDVIIRSRCFLYKTGNINEESFLRIWNNEAYRRFRRELMRSRGGFPVCPRCCGMF